MVLMLQYTQHLIQKDNKFKDKSVTSKSLNNQMIKAKTKIIKFLYNNMWMKLITSTKRKIMEIKAHVVFSHYKINLQEYLIQAVILDTWCYSLLLIIFSTKMIRVLDRETTYIRSMLQPMLRRMHLVWTQLKIYL